MSNNWQPGYGTTGLSTKTGFTVNVDSSPNVFNYPFKITISSDKVSIRPGTVNNLIPKIGSTLLIDSTPPTLTINTNVDQYIYIKCGPDADSLNFPSNTISATGYPEIIASDSALKNSDDNGYLLLGTITEKGTLISQFIQNSVGAERHKFSQPNSSVYYFWRI